MNVQMHEMARDTATTEEVVESYRNRELMGLNFRVFIYHFCRQTHLLFASCNAAFRLCICKSPSLINEKMTVDALTSSAKFRFASDAASSYQIEDPVMWSESPMRFLSVHFRLLQSLYKDSGEPKSDTDENDTNTGSSGVIDATIWERIQDFMEQRDMIFGDRQQMRQMSEVNQELTHYACSSPPNTGRSSDALRDPPSQSVLIVANLVQQRYHCFQAKKDLPSRTSRYEPLLLDLQQLVHSLQSQREQCVLWMRHAQFGSNSTTAPATIDRSWVTELDYKMQLWSMLIQDLKIILTPEQDVESI
jgi:hypothetical protein